MKSLEPDTFIIDTSDTFIWYFPSGLQYDNARKAYRTEELVILTDYGYSKESCDWPEYLLIHLESRKPVVFFVGGI